MYTYLWAFVFYLVGKEIDMADQRAKPGYSMKDWNVAGGRLVLFSNNPPTGFYRDGFCRTGADDTGNHSVAATINQDFLDFSASKGNNLKDAGVKAGMKWCLCASRWQEAMKAAQDGELSDAAVPRVHLHASDKSALDTVTYKDLKKYAAEGEATRSGRQSEQHNPEEHQGIASESKEISAEQPTVAPGAGRWQGRKGEVTNTDGSRG